ncbi:small RNA 2'-O-methyltransferase [Kryptolebias marmoratus]|uniref:small RNA 2'-O-methyltransferase n=1 Tax=Kryptolebias marmoratus TaxID=37003 RepID=UPI0007F926E7|nr:small RNA 2'-O-methyltransferase [Kryptolebias marmoratus]
MISIFSPALHKQRHQFVIDFVKKNKPRRVADLGCSECRLLKQLRFHREVQLLVGLDTNGAKIKKNMHGLAPLSTDYLQPTYNQLRVELYQGSVTQRDARLRGFDLVTSIELIEHLTLTDLEHFSAVVFGYMTPVSVIISTPNSEFNVLLPGLSGFRHSDHKFEWNRAEFQSWALKVCSDYGYEVEFTGVGEAPQGQQDSVGFCSQIGVFYRLKDRDRCSVLAGSDEENVFSYTLLYSVNYPSLHDNNTLRRVLVSEVLYWAEQLKNRWIEEKSGGRNGDFTRCQTVGSVPMEGKKAACEEKMDGPVNYGGRCDNFFWRNDPNQESGTLNSYVSVPLAVMWSWCPKVRELSESLGNLRHLLMDEPQVKLSQDGSAVLVKYQEQDEEEVSSDLEDSEYSEDSQCSYSVEQEEDWEANV